MKILIVRHADPDYSIDSLTETGWKEAEYLSEKLSKIEAVAYYCSPMGRAKDTASETLYKVNKEAEILEWLKEFPCAVRRPTEPFYGNNTWDWLPADWTAFPEFFDINKWHTHPHFEEINVKGEYDRVVGLLDELIEKHGYKRNGFMYDAVTPNNDTIVIFCHFGLECVLLSRLLNISPVVLWHGFCAAPSSVTTLVSEERREGKAYFRASSMGDVSHLYAHDQQPSFAARFCECYTNSEERHD